MSGPLASGKKKTMTLFAIEFYVPRNELDATKEIMYNSIDKHVMSE